jgi:hypothetical protein
MMLKSRQMYRDVGSTSVNENELPTGINMLLIGITEIDCVKKHTVGIQNLNFSPYQLPNELPGPWRYFEFHPGAAS